MSNKTAVQLILDKFNLLSDNDFKSWMLNYHDELIQMEREQIEDAHEIGYINGGNSKKVNGEQYYKETYGETKN